MIKVLSPGIYSSIQDFGRYGFQEYGVPYSGVMDRQAASLANLILGNVQDLPVLEITMQGPKLQFNCKTSICVSGAEMTSKLNGKSIFNNKPYLVKPEDILSFGKLNNGMRAYLAVLGGFNTEKVMQSYSMYPGITSAFKLSRGQKLQILNEGSSILKHHASVKVDSCYLNSKEIEVFKGSEFDKLSEFQRNFLLSQEFSISKDNNRMAYQLNEVLKNDLEPIITSPVLPGTVQLTPSGKLIVLMRDCQTTGGYPRVLQLKESAINILAQKFTGHSVNFNLCSK